MFLSVFDRTVVYAYTQLLVWSKLYQSLPFPLLPITPALKCRANLGAPISLARSCRTSRKRHPRGGRSSSFSSAPLPLRLRRAGGKKPLLRSDSKPPLFFRAEHESRADRVRPQHPTAAMERHGTAQPPRLGSRARSAVLSWSLFKRLLRDTASIGARRKVYDPLG